jgi:hypothetical protein
MIYGINRRIIKMGSNILKSNFNLKIITIERQEEDKLKVIDSKVKRCRRKDFLESLDEDRKNGIKRKVEYVNDVPDKFQIGVVYIRKDGEFAWIYKEN